MSTRNLRSLFHPASVAVIGASRAERSVGATVMRNLLAAEFGGPIMPVNPRHRSVAGVLAYPDVASLPEVPELAVICTPSEIVPRVIAELGERGTRAALVLSDDRTPARTEPPEGRATPQAMLDAARPHCLRLLGPGSLGVLVPGAALNASFAPVAMRAGRVALVHQSGALCTALLDWAYSNGIGFSHFVSIGAAVDIDFADVIDYLGSDPDAHAILMYAESVRSARKFMSAARAAARNKPLVVVKAGRVPEGARAATSHSGAMAGSDEVFDAAFRRAGMLRVYDTVEMFHAAETLSLMRRAHGERLAILTNGGGPGVIATDALVLGRGVLASFGEATARRLGSEAPGAVVENPLDIGNDAERSRYVSALEALLVAPEVDAVLVLHAPSALSSGDDIADGLIAHLRGRGGGKQVFACWLGGDSAAGARRRLMEAGVATYGTPEQAVRAFMHLVDYRRNQELLMETPPSIPESFRPDAAAARAIVGSALQVGRRVLGEAESRALLATYGIPAIETHSASDAEEAARVAADLGGPVALKIASPAITHKSEVGGVVLDLDGPEEVREAALAMSARLARRRPGVRCEGFTVQPMVRRPTSHELLLGVFVDPVFGPALTFGAGGTAVEVIADRAVALPPLNLRLARDLMERTRVARLLAGYRDRPAADLEAIALALVKLSQMVTDLGEILELDINPLLADAQGVLALDARVVVAPCERAAAARLAIRPYPTELEEGFALDGASVRIRPIRPEDEPQHRALVGRLDPEDIRMRFFGTLRELTHSQLARFTQIDYDREMAFIASAAGEPGGEPRTLGVVRTVTDADNECAEFALIVESSLKGKGLGRRLLHKMIEYCRARGTRCIVGQVLPDNDRMLRLCRRLGFAARFVPGDDVVEVRLELRA